MVPRKITETEICERVFEEATVGMAVFDRSLKLVKFNRVLPSTFGYSENELSEKTIADLIYPDDLERIVKKTNNLFLKQISFDVETRCLKKGSEMVWIHFYASPVKFTEEEVFFGLLEDITSRKKLEERLKESESNYHTMVEMSPNAVAIHWGGKILYVNDAAVKMLGAKKTGRNHWQADSFVCSP